MGACAVVVGVDGSRYARAALRWAVKEAELRDATLEVVHAWQPPDASDGYGPDTIPALSPGSSERLAGQLGEVAAAEARSVSPDLDILVIIIRGHPEEVLLSAAQRAELVVVGSRGTGGFPGLPVGSTSQHCVNYSPCPVVVVRPLEETVDDR